MTPELTSDWSRQDYTRINFEDPLHPWGFFNETEQSQVEFETKVHQKVRNHGEGPYQGLLLVESGYYRFHI